MADDARQVAVGKAVAEFIAAADLSQKATVERSYADWDLKLESMDLLELQQNIDKLRIDVVVHSTLPKPVRISRGSVEFIIPVDIAVRRKFGADLKDDKSGRPRIEEVDKLIGLVEEITLLFRRDNDRVFEFTIDEDTGDGVTILANPHPQHLREKQQFTGMVRMYVLAEVTL